MKKASATRNEDNQAENNGLFVHATALISDRLSMVAGLRHSTGRFTSDDHFLSDGNGSGSVSYQASSLVLALSYHANDNLNPYANYGKGFESPILAEAAYGGGGTPTFSATINASGNQQYELGAKWAPSSWSRLDFALFQIDSRDEIVVSSSSGGNSTFKNAPGNRRTGWELAG